jgi:hypothetical protein
MYWKDKLEGLNNLSHENWDTNSLWEKLDNRIHKRRLSRKFLIGLVVGTACLVLVAGLIWISGNKKHVELYSNRIYQPVDTKKSAPVAIGVEKDVNGSKKQSPRPNNTAASQIIAPKENLVFPVITEKMEEQTTEQKKEEINSGTALVTDSVVATSRPLQNLRVVHINELGKPARENIKIARASRSVHEGYSKKALSDFFSNNSDDNIFKIELSSHKSE